ncbi:hypothetical protein [Aquimarina rhabdastrellae]
MKNWDDPTLVRVYERFLEAAKYVIAHNRKEGKEPHSLNGLAIELNPTNRIFISLMQKKSSGVPLKSLAHFIQNYNLDANYFFKEDVSFSAEEVIAPEVEAILRRDQVLKLIDKFMEQHQDMALDIKQEVYAYLLANEKLVFGRELSTELSDSNTTILGLIVQQITEKANLRKQMEALTAKCNAQQVELQNAYRMQGEMFHKLNDIINTKT